MAVGLLAPLLALSVAAVAGGGAFTEAVAQDKGKPIRLVVGYAPGGASDRAARRSKARPCS